MILFGLGEEYSAIGLPKHLLGESNFYRLHAVNADKFDFTQATKGEPQDRRDAARTHCTIYRRGRQGRGTCVPRGARDLARCRS